MNEWIEEMDDGTLLVRTQEGPKKVSRDDKLQGHPLSGLAQYGEIVGDWRMVEMISEDCQDVFAEDSG